MNSVWRRVTILVGVLVTLVAPLFVFAPTASAAVTCRPSPLQPRNNANDLTDVAYDQYKYTLTADGRCLLTVDNNNQCPATAHTENTATRQCWECPVGYTDTGGAGNDNEKWAPGATGSCKPPAGATDPTVPTCDDPGLTYVTDTKSKYYGYCTGPLTGAACPGASKQATNVVCIGDASNVPDAATGKCPTGWTKVVDAKTKKTKCNHTVPKTLEEVNPDAGGDKEAAADGCPVEPGVEFRWAICPVFFAMSGLTKTLDYFIDTYMATGNAIFATTQNGYKAAWTVFRNISIGLVVIAGLIMLASEAFGVPLVDAYTVRKVLPRLLVAIVGISISWEFSKFLIGFFDDLGRSIGSIIYSSFNVTKGVDIATVITGQLLLAGAAVGAAIFLTGAGILSLLGSLVLAMLVAAAVLVIRQAVIVACVIFAPLAIAAYILPNTNKLATFWWDTLWRMLALYPLANGLIALCKVLGKLTMGA